MEVEVKMMKRITLVLVVVMGWSVISLAQGEEELLSLVYERPYPGQDITRSLKKAEQVEYFPLFLVEDDFSSEEVKTLGLKTRLKDEKKALAICYPKVVLVEKGEKGIGKSPEEELLFLDKFGQIKKTYKLKHGIEVEWSKNQKYLCLYDISDISENKRKVVILDANGNELWSYREAPLAGCEVSPNGDYVIEYPDCEYASSDELWLHSRQGKKKINLPSNLGPYVDICENGEYFAVSSGEYLILFDKKGNELWQREGNSPDQPYFLKNEFIGIASDDLRGDEWITYFWLYDIKGNLLWKNKAFVSIEAVYYAEEEGRVYVLSGWGYFFCFDIVSGKLVTKYSAKEAPPFISSHKFFEGKPNPATNPLCPNWGGIITNRDGSKIITFDCRKEEDYPERVELFDKELRRLEQKEYPDNYIKITNRWEPVIKFSKDNLLSIMTNDGLKVYEVK